MLINGKNTIEIMREKIKDKFVTETRHQSTHSRSWIHLVISITFHPFSTPCPYPSPTHPFLSVFLLSFSFSFSPYIGLSSSPSPFSIVYIIFPVSLLFRSPFTWLPQLALPTPPPPPSKGRVTYNFSSTSQVCRQVSACAHVLLPFNNPANILGLTKGGCHEGWNYLVFGYY